MESGLGPPVLVGEKVYWLGKPRSKPVRGVVKWIGNIPELSPDWCVGVELDAPLPGLECNGFWKNRKLFECRSKHGLIAPMKEIHKIHSKTNISSRNGENDFRLHLDDSQIGDFARSNLRGKYADETQRKNRYSYSELKSTRDLLRNWTSDPGTERKFDSKSVTDLSSDAAATRKTSKRRSQDVEALLRREETWKNSEKSNKNFKGDPATRADSGGRDNLQHAQTIDFKSDLSELMKNMNEIAGYFKEIKEGEERFENQNKMEDLVLYGAPDTNEPGQSKPKKLFSFLKWFNKKQKHEPNLKLFKESSAASSPMFPRKQTSSCESIDTLFSTQTVRSFAYIPPTQYVPSAPPLELDRSSYENLCEDDSSRKNRSDETDSIYERRKKRRAPEPPRLSRENSLPTTLDHKKNEQEDFDGIKTYHRRTVSESFKDKKAGAYCHVQGKRKAPPPPASPLYPNLQKLDNQYPSLYKKKKPAPPPPEVNTKTQNQNDGQQGRTGVQKDAGQSKEEVGGESGKESRDNGIPGKDEMGARIGLTSKGRLTKDSSLSPLPSRPWYKRSHRDSTGSNIIRKDLLKGFDKRKNKESDDWMPEVGYSRRSLSSESGHSKFNIFSKLDKNEDKKKEEKRKSQISILTNISELDREAAEIVRKEQAEERKMKAANDAKYYSRKETDRKEELAKQPTNEKGRHFEGNEISAVKSKPLRDEQEGQGEYPQAGDGGRKPRAISEDFRDVKSEKNNNKIDHQLKIKEKMKDKENFLKVEEQPKELPKQGALSSNILTDVTNPSGGQSTEKAEKPSQNPSQVRLNHFNVENKSLNYLNEPWVCKKCTLENPGWRVFCEICNSVKPRFLYNNTPQNADLSKEQNLQRDTQKTERGSEETGKVKEPSPKNEKQAIPETAEEIEKEEPKQTETLDELRKKRMNFFNSKMGSLPESGKSEREPFPSSSKVVMQPQKESSPKQKEEKAIGAEPVEQRTASAEPKVETAKPRERHENVVKAKSKTDGVQVKQNSNNLNTTGGEPKVIEAYVVTKTIVLEDIIVKKPERGRKVSASVQTKSRASPSPETKVISPPPRTKKIVYEAVAEAKKEKETESQTENGIKNVKEEELEELTNKLTRAEGLADFRANIETMPPNTEMNTVAVNRLLRKLETAINCGDHFVAGGLAKELAMMKINCSVTRQVTPSPSTPNITVDLYIEDKISHQGPIPIEVSPTMSVLQLKNKIQQQLGIPLEIQRWILGKKLATDDSKTLESEGVKNSYCPLFLYLVAPDNRKANKEAPTKPEKPKDEPPGGSESAEGSSSTAKGVYYNYEEDRYSFCEDSEEEEEKSSSPELNNNTKQINNTTENTTDSDKKDTNLETAIKKNGSQSSIFDLKSREAENDIDKELKLISANSVKQKVEQLNKTFAENARAAKPPLRSSRSPETWKCGACSFVNLPGKLNCTSCNVKKVFSGPYSKNLEDRKDLAKKEPFKKESPKPPADKNIHYKALMQLQDADLVISSEPFYCSICLVDYAPGEGITLKDCLHTFCRPCLVSTVQFSEDAEVKCPYVDETYSCPSVLQQREIKALVPQGIFELHLAKSVKEAENKIDNAFHCKTPDCKGWCIYEDNVNEFRCPVCKATNCLTCQAVHTGINCREFQERMKVASETDVDAKKTTDMLKEMVEKGEAMACPKCQVLLLKKWGCDWLKCSMCKTEICWVTRGFRWGPEGKGDTSGGCKCGVNGVKCHPKCNYCH